MSPFLTLFTVPVREPSFKTTNLHKWRFIAPINCDPCKSCSPIRQVFNKVDSVHRRPCICNKDLCGYCDTYERRYPPENLADVDKIAGKLSAVKKLAVAEGNIVGESEVTLPCVGSDHHVVVCLNDG